LARSVARIGSPASTFELELVPHPANVTLLRGLRNVAQLFYLFGLCAAAIRVLRQ
jgi:hypothetical protein